MTRVADQPPKPRVKRWTKLEYYDLVERGAFQKQRVFLHRGELIEMPPMGSLHSFGVTNITEWLCSVFSPQYRVRIQQPFDVDGPSVPEPDGAVVTHEQMACKPCPNQAILVIEVSDSSLELDQDLAFDYAGGKVQDYWILNMRDRQIEVYRDSTVDASSPTGYRYASHVVLYESDFISPLASPGITIAVAALTKTA